MEKVLKAIGNFFKKIWGWIKNTAWIQPLLIVIIIFGIIFSINPIIKGVKGAMNSGDKEGAFYKSHDTKFSNLHEGKKYVEQSDCLVVYVDLENESKKETANGLEKYLKNFSSQNSGVKIYVVNIGSKDFLGDDKGKENIEETYSLYADLYNGDKNDEFATAYLPTDKFTYDIKYSAWDSNGENEYLKGNTDSIYINSPTYVKYHEGKPVDMRFDLESYKSSTTGNQINGLTVLNDLWNGTNK